MSKEWRRNSTYCRKPRQLRAAWDIEAGPIFCVKRMKSSLVIGQKVEMGSNPFTPRGWANLVEWILYSRKTWSHMTWARWIGFIKKWKANSWP